MKIAALKEGGRDGTLIVVSRDLSQAVKVAEIAPTLQVALDDWAHIASHLQSAYELLNEGKLNTAFALEPTALWFDSFPESAPDDSIMVQLASMRFGSTGWDNATYVADSLRGPIHFDIGFISHENNSNFSPPPSVSGFYDPVRDVVTPTQALQIMFKDFNAQTLINTPDSGLMLIADTGKAERTLDRAINLTGFENLEAFVFGYNIEEDSVLLFFRMGADEDVYFEYRTILKTGWDPENHVFFDLVEVEVMKDQFLRDRRSGIDSSLTRQSGKYLVKVTENNHAPNITLVKYFAVGVINLDPDDTAEGDVWIYGLRQTGHRAFE